MQREAFLSELKTLQDKFSKLKPELEVTVRDPKLEVEGFVVVWSTLASQGGPLGEGSRR